MKNDFDIIVLGAGMVGAAAALALSRKGISIAIVERQSTLAESYQITDEPELRQSAISPASQELLNQLGVWAEIEKQRSCHYQRMTVWHESGSVEMNFASEQVGATHLGTIVENRLIQYILLKQLNNLANVTLFGEQEVISIDQQPAGVEIQTSAKVKLTAKLLIAADGRGSTASRLLKLPVTSGNYNQTAIVANVTTENGHQNTAWQRFLSTGPLAFLPLSNGQSSIVWSADTERAQELLALDDKAFMVQLGYAFERRLGKVTSCSQRMSFPLSWHSADRWLQGHVLLIGDAAHGVHPLAGQGVNLGFGDVSLLRQLLDSGQELFSYKLLRQFERQRKAETVTATHLFSALKQLYAQQNPLLCLARDLGMSVIENTHMLKRKVVQNAIENQV